MRRAAAGRAAFPLALQNSRRHFQSVGGPTAAAKARRAPENNPVGSAPLRQQCRQPRSSDQHVPIDSQSSAQPPALPCPNPPPPPQPPTTTCRRPTTRWMPPLTRAWRRWARWEEAGGREATGATCRPSQRQLRAARAAARQAAHQAAQLPLAGGRPWPPRTAMSQPLQPQPCSPALS